MATGYVGILTVELHFPESGSLKGKRKHVKSAKAQLHERFGASVAEVDHHDLWQRSRLAVACATREHSRAARSSSTRSSATSARRSGSSCAPSGRWSSLASAERRRKVNEAIRKVLSEALPTLKDPRIGFVTVTGVKTTTDLAQATVFVSVLGTESEQERTLDGLQSAHGVLQAQVARELGTRRTPVLTFEYDPAIERGVRLTKLIDDLAPADPDGDEPTDMQAVVTALREHERFVVTSHEAPDGDALGSLLATGLALQQLGKDVVDVPRRAGAASGRVPVPRARGARSAARAPGGLRGARPRRRRLREPGARRRRARCRRRGALHGQHRPPPRQSRASAT